MAVLGRVNSIWHGADKQSWSQLMKASMVESLKLDINLVLDV